MMGRFFDEVEKRYMSCCDEQDVLIFYQSGEEGAYHALLERALRRGSGVTPEEIIALVGSEEGYRHTMEIVEAAERELGQEKF